MLCALEDSFINSARQRIRDFRGQEALKDPVSRSIFHRAQCVWRLGMDSEQEALADGLFESLSAASTQPPP